MGWQEDNNNKSPKRPAWGQNTPTGANRSSNPSGQPDLEVLLKRLQSRFGGVFGGSGQGRGRHALTLTFWAVFLIIVWSVTGFYRVDEGQRALEFVFGKLTATTQAGLHWRPPQPIGHVEFVMIDQIVNLPIQTRMLTADENIVEVDLVVQYRRNDAERFQLNVDNPEPTVQEVTESAIRDVVGGSSLDYVLTEGLSEIGVKTKELVQRTLNDYDTGIEIVAVNMQQAEFPSEVQAAVKDAIKAREDKEAAVLESEAYSNDIVPRARGQAKQEIERAKAYRARVSDEAKGEAQRFDLLLGEYRKAPQVTRERLYYETMESVLAASRKIVVDGKNANVLYLPLDKMMPSGSELSAPAAGGGGVISRSDASNSAPAASGGSAAVRERGR